MIQNRTDSGAPASSHPAFEPHPIQGWTPVFIPLVLQESVDRQYYDELIRVSGADNLEWAHKLARKESIMTRMSVGASFAIAMQVAAKAARGSVV